MIQYFVAAMFTAICTSGLSLPAHPQTQPKAEYVGKVRTGLGLAWAGLTPLKFALATPEDLKKLPFGPNEGDKVFTNGTSSEDRFPLAWFITRAGETIKIKSIPLLLIETKDGNLTLYGDLDGDGRFSPTEGSRFSPIFDRTSSVTREPFERFGQMVAMDRETTITFPIPGSFFKRYTENIYLSSLYDTLRSQAKIEPNTRILWRSLYKVANGEVMVSGRKVLVQFGIDPRDGSMLPTGFRGIDCDGDGKINNKTGSIESAYLFDGDETPVFHVGDHYLSIDRFDKVTGKITLGECLASEYGRIELRKGTQLADFEFIDLNGKNGRLSEFRGKYLLLDFWGTWCSGCREEVPFYKKAYEKYRGRGFEILGIDAEETKDRLAEFVLKNRITWRQATAESTEKLLRKKLRIQDHGYPTRVLLDPQGKILSLGHDRELPLGGKDLIKTLETLLPKELAPAVQKQ